MKDELEIIFKSKLTTQSVKFNNMDVDLPQIFEAIEGLLVGLTYPQEVINRYYKERAEELKDED